MTGLSKVNLCFLFRRSENKIISKGAILNHIQYVMCYVSFDSDMTDALRLYHVNLFQCYTRVGIVMSIIYMITLDRNYYRTFFNLVMNFTFNLKKFIS